MTDSLALRFLGVGNARASELGSASAVLEAEGEPLLLIDCGPRTLDDYRACYGDAIPKAVFITHLHLDHIGGIEALFYRAYFADQGLVRLHVPAAIVPALHAKLAGSAFVLSEGNASFWDAFQLLPVGEFMWLRGLLLSVFPVRHSGYHQAFGLCLPGAFAYTGDTRPIPEVLGHFARSGEPVFHDCGVEGSPAHAGADDIAREYSEEQKSRLVLYHYESEAAGRELERRGFRVAKAGERFLLKPPLPVSPRPAATPEAPSLTRVV
jgi:glyoxylase-like metal-dependent hydrolase (beta-lactamase superfamily II)